MTWKDSVEAEGTARSSREFLRRRNRYFILKAIDKAGPLSRHDIVNLVRIRPATVIHFVDKLIKDGFVSELGPGESSGGRRPILLEFNPEARLAIGVYLGEARIMAAMVNLRGKIIRLKKREVGGFGSKEQLTADTVRIISKLIINSATKKEKVIGIGLGVPGLVDRKKGVSLFCALYRWWKEIPFKEILEKKFGVSVHVENDTRVLTLAEKWFGLGKEINNFLYLDVEEGIALGMFLDGILYDGVGGSAGELGHVTIDSNGPLCKCGNRGCLEAVASTDAIEERIKELLSRGAQSILKDNLKGKLERVRFSDIVRAAKSGDGLARQVLEEAGRYLGIGVANLVNLLNPGLIIVGGLITQVEEFVLEPMKVILKQRALSKPAGEVQIRVTQLSETAGALGAASLVLQKFFETY